MIRIFKTVEGKLQKIPTAEEGSWVAMTNPTQDELISISEQFLIDLDDLKGPLDEKSAHVSK